MITALIRIARPHSSWWSLLAGSSSTENETHTVKAPFLCACSDVALNLHPLVGFQISHVTTQSTWSKYSECGGFAPLEHCLERPVPEMALKRK